MKGRALWRFRDEGSGLEFEWLQDIRAEARTVLNGLPAAAPELDVPMPDATVGVFGG